jgi:hypothetical protein
LYILFLPFCRAGPYFLPSALALNAPARPGDAALGAAVGQYTIMRSSAPPANNKFKVIYLLTHAAVES